jgi:hypothetical protein
VNIWWTIQERILLEDLKNQCGSLTDDQLKALKNYASEKALETAVIQSTKITLSGISIVFGYIIILCLFGPA